MTRNMNTVQSLACPICGEALGSGRTENGIMMIYCRRCHRSYQPKECKMRKFNLQAFITPRHYERSA